MIDHINAEIETLAIHRIGNKTNDEELQLSKKVNDVSDEEVRNTLHRYLISPFESPEFYKFTFTNGDHNLNPLYNFVSDIFDNRDSFFENSVNIAKHLYETSLHPNIKSGDLFVTLISEIDVEGETTDAVGIFKAENKQDFIKVNASGNGFDLKFDDGININKLDKGCLIYDIDRKSGFKISTIDRSNKLTEAQFWTDLFLMLKPSSDDYQHTKEFMNITKNFVTKQLKKEFEVSKTDQIDMLNKSVEYFKTNEKFDKEEFESQIFNDPEVINSFRSYDETYRADHEMDAMGEFDISSQAVKKQARVFKSVLKLDKNFHIYIHGNRSLIEQGVDVNGKYYKIYYEKER